MSIKLTFRELALRQSELFIDFRLRTESHFINGHKHTKPRNLTPSLPSSASNILIMKKTNKILP